MRYHGRCRDGGSDKEIFLKLLLIIQLLIATFGGISFTILTSSPLQISVVIFFVNVQTLERRNINIKRFDEIPMADAEMVFPDKKIFLKPLLIIQLLIAIIGGIIATFAALLSVSNLLTHFM